MILTELQWSKSKRGIWGVAACSSTTGDRQPAGTCNLQPAPVTCITQITKSTETEEMSPLSVDFQLIIIYLLNKELIDAILHLLSYRM